MPAGIGNASLSLLVTVGKSERWGTDALELSHIIGGGRGLEARDSCDASSAINSVAHAAVSYVGHFPCWQIDVVGEGVFIK